MADYWKSQPRKFCDFCKCWITDNKPSVEFHERGKRHKENVQKRIDEVRKKSADKARAQEEMDEDMAKMEKAAMEALRRDLARDPSLAAQYGVKLKSSESEEKTEEAKKEKLTKTSEKSEAAAPAKVKEWFEAKSPEGYSYYWNVSTNETKWDAPDEYVSLAEQEGEEATEDRHKQDSEQESADEAEPEQSTSTEEPEIEEPPVKTFRIDPVGPRSAYGAWETVRQETVPEQEIPLPAEPMPISDIPLPGEAPEAPPTEGEPTVVKKDRFKEKTVTSLGPPSGGNVGFIKRKIASGARNMRQRDSDD